MKALEGWAIEIMRTDGVTFLATAGHGTYPGVWCKANRKHAVEYKRDLLLGGMKCRVVPVLYTRPVVQTVNCHPGGKLGGKGKRKVG